MKPVKEDTLKKLVHLIATTRSDEIGCTDCFDHMDRFVELVVEGTDPAEAFPLVQHHLEICHCCYEEYEALVEAIQAIQDSPPEE